MSERFTYSIAARNLEAAWREADSARKLSSVTEPMNLAGPVPIQEFKIVQVVRDMIAGGGVEMVAFELARAWQRSGIDNLTIARNAGRTFEPTPSHPVGGSVGSESSDAWHVPLFRPLAGRADFHPLPQHGPCVAIVMRSSSVMAIVLLATCIVVHAVNAASLAAKKSAGSWKWMFNPMHAWAGLRDRYMIGGLRYRHFIAVSLRAGRELQEYYGVPNQRITVIPNGIDVERFKPDATARQSVRDEFGIQQAEQLLLFVGHEFERKGLAHVIDALNRLPDNVRLLVVGSDLSAPYKRMFKGVPERLIFANERLDMPALYAAADAFVLPSQYETFALVGMEAMACGVPVFATMVGGIEDYLQDGVNGIAIEANGADIAPKLAMILNDPAQHAVLAKGARSTANSYSWPTIAARYVELLETLWRQKPAAAASEKLARSTATAPRSSPHVTPAE